ncbi:MAG: NnrS family protein [Gemmataceae bacterium]|nr:NnrS family protein [Gemmataceae bacterium]
MALVDALDERLLIPDLLRAAPQTRRVLDRYGLRGCGGPLGPHESLGFFAHAHEVPVEQLLGELRACLTAPVPPTDTAGGPTPGPADAIYRPFFKGGIAVVLTLGAVWGAYLLLRIGLEGSFTAAGLHEVNAHGHAQIFGWVGLFVMGFAYQAFPRFKHADLAHPRLARASLWLMLAGIVVRSVCEPLVDAVAWAWLPAVAASGLEVLAAGLFAWVIVATWRRCGKPLAFYDYYIASAMVWFVLQAAYEGVYLFAIVSAVDREALLDLVKTWQGPLREMQIHGFALLMILGVSQRLFHHFYGLPAPQPRRSLIALAALNAAVAGEVVGLVLMRTAGHAWAGLWYASVLLLAGTVVCLVVGWHIFSPAPETDRSLKFLRAAYVWLLLSLALLVLLPAYQYALLPWLAPGSGAAELGFSHAYYGAIRHAITVGFISLMIVGVAAKVVPTLNGVDVRALTPLWGPFVLINAGCALRVGGQILTDFTQAAFPVAGVSGTLEVLGLLLWGAHLWSIMAGRKPCPNRPALGPLTLPSPPSEGGEGRVRGGEPIAAGHRVGAVLDRYPALLPVFLSFGFKPLASPVLRRTVARRITLAAACRFLGVDVQALLDALNREREYQATGRYPLPLVGTP